MCGYEPGTARKGKFSLPRVVQISNEEFSNMDLPIQNRILIAIATVVKFAGSENIYPNKIGSYHVGNAHWATLVNSRMYHNIKLKHTLNDLINLVEGTTVSLHGGRFVSWVIAKELDKKLMK